MPRNHNNHTEPRKADDEISDQVNFRANDPDHPTLARDFYHAIHDHKSDRSAVLRELLDAYVRKVNELGRPPKFPLVIHTKHHGRR